MKKSIITLSLILWAFSTKAQTDSASLIQGIRAAADSMTTAFRNKDFITFAHFNNTRLLDMLGGESGFAEFIEKQIELLKDVRFTEMKAGRIIRVLAYNGTHQCIIEQQSEIKMEGMLVSAVSHLVGLSLDGGKSWRFADANNGTKEEFASIMPELSSDMIIPKKKQEMGKSLAELLKDYKTEYLP
jgi:hypothetical protein